MSLKLDFREGIFSHVNEQKYNFARQRRVSNVVTAESRRASKKKN